VESIANSDIINELKKFDTPTVSNAIESFKLRDRTEGYAAMNLRCLSPELNPMVGYAVTCTVDGTTPGTPTIGKRLEFLELLNNMPKPSVVVFQTIGPEPLKTCVAGDMICLAYSKLGAVGLVSDGAIRDLSGIRKNTPDFNIFAQGMVASHGNLTKIEINIPVNIGGMQINPGDLLHGDENGIIKIPTEIAKSVVKQSQIVREEESKIFETLHQKSLSLEELKDEFS